MDIDLILFKKDGSRKTFSLRDDNTIIGRHDDCDLRIPLKDVSRKHCQISRNNESIKIRDLDSRNGTFINGKRINEETTAKAGDYITISPLTFLLQINGEPKKIIPPNWDKPAPKEQKKEPPKKKPTAAKPSGSSPEIDLDASDSFAAELEDLDDLDELEDL
jgi:pSer/pThr/pTyr-binding forkhead associated (FHA) protein